MAKRDKIPQPTGKAHHNRTNVPPESELQTVKQQRGARRAQKLAKFKHEQVRAKRRKLLVAIIAITAGVAAAALVVVLVVTSGTPQTVPAAIDGVRTFPSLAATHVPDPVSYPENPPVGGPHSSIWLNCGVYSEPVPNENAVHSLEHGAVWVTYDPSVIDGDTLAALRKMIPSSYAILSPDSTLSSAVVVSAWGIQLQVDSVDDPRIGEFITKYRNGESTPEPGAACTGGLDGPGKIS